MVGMRNSQLPLKVFGIWYSSWSHKSTWVQMEFMPECLESCLMSLQDLFFNLFLMVLGIWIGPSRMEAGKCTSFQGGHERRPWQLQTFQSHVSA